MVHQQFIGQILEFIKSDDNIIGLTVGGSWIQKEIDDYSDLDLVLVTRVKITYTPGIMMEYA